MKYIANPVEVEAHKITMVHKAIDWPDPLGAIVALELDNRQRVHPTEAMMSRMEPRVGDYWVVQSDGYVYLNPKEVFERKYSPKV